MTRSLVRNCEARRTPIVVWDFDGVLNRAYDEHGFLWCRALEEDLGVPSSAFQALTFGGGRFRDVLIGRTSITDHLENVVARLGLSIEPQVLVDYWIGRDFNLNVEVLNVVGDLLRLGVTSIIGTNNDPVRAAAIRARKEVTDGFEEVIASGDVGIAKPAPEFFAIVARKLGMTPSDLLLVDDTKANLDTAAVMGWRTLAFGDANAWRAGSVRRLRSELMLAYPNLPI